MKLSLDISIRQPQIIQHYIALAPAPVQMAGRWRAGTASPAERLMAGISPLSLANHLQRSAVPARARRDLLRELVRPPPTPVAIPALAPAPAPSGSCASAMSRPTCASTPSASP